MDLRALDLRLFRAFHPDHAAGALPYVMVALTHLGDGWILVATIPFLVKRATRTIAAYFLGAVTLNWLVVELLKRAVGRDRPFRVVEGVQPLLVDGPLGKSFPSGHAAGAFTVASFLFVLFASRSPPRGQLFGVAALLFAFAIGVASSRVYLGVHFPSDVIAGSILGATIGALCAREAARRITPTLPPPAPPRSLDTSPRAASLESTRAPGSDRTTADR